VTAVSTSKHPARIAGMFDAIAPRYDVLNHLLSAGLDRTWRRSAVRELRLTGRERVLDMCTGTGDLAIEAATATAGHAATVIGIDFAGEMLRRGTAKIRRTGLTRRIHLARGDAVRVPLPNACCDAVTIAFGIRNVMDPLLACREFARVVRPGGRLAVLEFGAPAIPGCRQLYGWYFRAVLPRIGRLISKHGEAYAYLPASVAEFPSPQAFMAILQDAGFSRVRYVPLTFGIVSLYVAER
jgi:demethylmenaquinone methyltransferase/2-methoxy-6-polyprenyl-1,4-benzoquinol methylase